MEAGFPDWACLSGDVLYQLLYANGRCRFVRVPLDGALIASIRVRDPKGQFSLYRDRDGRVTPVARFVALFCLEQGVPVRAISRLIGVSESAVRRWQRDRRRVASIEGNHDVLNLLRVLAFKGEEVR